MPKSSSFGTSSPFGPDGDEDVLGLHVAVDDALRVRRREPVAGLDQDVEQPVDGHRLLDQLVERSAVEELHAHVDAAVGELAEVLDRR